jgi:hypothetical protein
MGHALALCSLPDSRRLAALKAEAWANGSERLRLRVVRTQVVLAGVGALALLAACGSSGARHATGDKRLLSVLSATASSESFRYQTVTREVTSGATHQTSSRTTDGMIDYAHKTGVQARGTSDPHQSPFEFRAIDGVGYQLISGDVAGLYGAPKGTKWIRTDADRIASAGGCVHYYIGSTANSLVGGTFVGLPDPESALDSLRSTSARLEKDGTEDVRGVSTTRWRIDAGSVPTTTIPSNCAPALSGVHEGARRVEIWTDAQHRLRRVVTTSTTNVSNLLGQSFDQVPNAGPSSIARTITTEFFDFGVVVRVDAPPAAEVFDASAVVGAMLAGPGTVADDAWQVVAYGSFRGVDWRVWYAATSTKWRCYSTDGLPASSGNLPDVLNIDIYPKHDGKPSDCSPASIAGGNGPLTAFVAGFDGDRWTLVGRVDDSAENATLRFADGTSIALPIDAQGRIVQWVGPTSPAPTEFQSGDSKCTLSDNVDTAGDEQTCNGVDSGPPLALAPLAP